MTDREAPVGGVEQEAERMPQLVGGEVSAGRASAGERAVVRQRAGPGVLRARVVVLGLLQQVRDQAGHASEQGVSLFVHQLHPLVAIQNAL